MKHSPKFTKTFPKLWESHNLPVNSVIWELTKYPLISDQTVVVTYTIGQPSAAARDVWLRWTIGWDGLGVCITYFFSMHDLSAGLPGQGHGWVCELLPLFRQYKGTKFIQYSRIYKFYNLLQRPKTICCHIKLALCTLF